MEKFKVPFPGKEEMPLDVEMIKPPRIGFIGTIDRRIDINLIFNTASQKPGWSIILIGANRLTRKANKHLKRLSNIYFLGIKSHKEIPYYIMAMDVCIIPYLVNEFTRFIFPLKFLEYLAAGKPVVSSFLPELTNFGDFVMISRDWKEFINNIELSISAGSNDFDKRREFVGFFSWKSKVEIISQIIMKELRYK